MVDTAIPVILHLAKGSEQSLCLATLKQENGRLYATPTLLGPAFAQFLQTEIDEAGLDLLPGRDGAQAFYHYRPLVRIGPAIVEAPTG
jgi:hypothetical protein